MNKKDLNNLLDSIYELEGLVHLAISRDDNPASLPELITRKGVELASLARIVSQSENSPVVVAQGTAVFDSTPEPEVKIMVEDTSESNDEPMYDEPMYDDSTEEEAPVIHIEETVVENEAFTEAPLKHPVAQERFEPRGRLVFSINDRYRFKRELFNNSDAEFNTTLALVASMENYDEAEDYFLGELQWDPANQDVTDFLEILKKYFNA